MDTKRTYYLFFDYDNTVRVNGAISDATVRAMKQAREAGHKLILCTGRARGSKIEELDGRIPWNGMIYGGCDIVYEGVCHEEKTVPDDEIALWVEYSMKNHRFFIMEGQREILILRFDQHGEDYTEEEIAAEQARAIAQAKTNPITKFSIMGSDFATAVLPNTKMNPLAHPTYLEVFGQGCDKGVAIKRFCGVFGVSLDQCVCFGDSMNDYPMFLTCSIGICMKWAPSKLAERATYVAQTDEGVAEGLSWLLEGKETEK